MNRRKFLSMLAIAPAAAKLPVTRIPAAKMCATEAGAPWMMRVSFTDTAEAYEVLADYVKNDVANAWAAYFQAYDDELIARQYFGAVAQLAEAVDLNPTNVPVQIRSAPPEENE